MRPPGNRVPQYDEESRRCGALPVPSDRAAGAAVILAMGGTAAQDPAQAPKHALGALAEQGASVPGNACDRQPITRLRCCATPTGSDRPGMTSASPAVSSTADRGFAGRQAPWSNEAEQAVLGAMLLDQDAALKAAELLDDSMFYKEGHRILFRAMTALTERNDVIDPVTMRDELVRRGDLDRAGGMEYIGALIDVVPPRRTSTTTRASCATRRVLRRLVEAATEVIQDVYELRARPVRCSTTPSTGCSR